MIPYNNLDTFKKFFFSNPDKVDIDSFHFKLHYRFTFIIFTLATILTTAKSYFTKAIICQHTSKISADLIDTYCWINSTFSVVDKLGVQQKGSEASYGLGNSNGQAAEQFTHSYYQWLPYFFFLQAVSFYLPHLVWKMCEGGKVKGVTKNIRGFHFNIDDKLRDVGRYINQDRQYVCSNRTLAIYIICESVNLLNMMLQCRLLNIFVDTEIIHWDLNFGEFFDTNSIKWTTLKKTFPTLAKCIYRDYGPSGDVQTLDALCLLPVNIFNEKIFLVLWAYLNLLTICTVVGLCCVIIRVIGFRFLPSLHYKYMHYFQSRSLHEINLINDLTESASMSDFFLFYLLEKNICRKNYMRLLKEIHTSEIEDKKNIDYKGDNGNDSSVKSNASYEYNV